MSELTNVDRGKLTLPGSDPYSEGVPSPRALVPAALVLLLLLGGISLIAAVMPSSWTALTAQPAPGDRLYLKLDGVTGEARDTDHSGELSIQSFTWTMTRSTDSSVRPQMKEFHVVMHADTGTPVLLRKSAARERIAKAVVSVRNSWGQDYMTWTLADVFITSFQVEEIAGQSKPQVTFDLLSTKIDVEYRTPFSNGALGPAVRSGWDSKGG